MARRMSPEVVHQRRWWILTTLCLSLVIVVVAFMFFSWLVPDRSQPEWVRSAKSRVVLTGTGQWLMSMLPEDPENTILKRLKKPRPEDTETPENAPPDQHSGLDKPGSGPGNTLLIGQGTGNRALR